MSAKPGRNDPCHCGSGKKYKRCHLPLDEQARLAARPPTPEPPEEAPFEGLEEAAPDWKPTPENLKNFGSLFKSLESSGMLKRDPELRRLFDENEVLIRYVNCEQEIEAASKELTLHEDGFKKLAADDEALNRITEKLFAEEAFRHLRFTPEQVEKAFEKAGYSPSIKGKEMIEKLFFKALLFLASKEYRKKTSMELLMLAPRYVKEGRLIQARLIEIAALATVEDTDETNPFLMQMFRWGLDEWAARKDQEQENLIEILGCDPKTMSPEELENWLEGLADPAQEKRLKEAVNACPGLVQSSVATEGTMLRQAIQLFEREDSACLLLRAEEMEPWAPRFNRIVEELFERYGPVQDGAQLSDTQQEEAYSTVYLPAMREIAKGVFSPERLRKLVADLKAYRKELFGAGEREAGLSATGAIIYVEREDDPSQNPFLINLCSRSIHAMADAAQEQSGEDVPAASSAGTA
ncbi:MAG TPA: SEC-C domain-containing protein [Verrucomicrobiae bacterium]|nr:SEC-C domain-containing protein [Verrucomicrobiae bacterium]